MAEKIGVLLEISRINLRRAEEAEGRGEWDDCIFHASLAIETASNALIVSLGGSEAVDHRAVSALDVAVRRKFPEWTVEEKFKEMIKRGQRSQREVVKTRYPHLVDGKWVTPEAYYKKGDAKKALLDAKFVLEVVGDYLKRR